MRRRQFCKVTAGAAAAAMLSNTPGRSAPGQPGARVSADQNLAPFATPSTSYVSTWENLAAINDGFDPSNMGDHSHDCYGNWPRTGTQWVELDWGQPINTSKIDVYWWDDGQGVRLPRACRLLYWNGTAFAPVSDAVGLGVVGGHYNTTNFREVTTPRLRLEMDGAGNSSTGIIEWKVYASGKPPQFPMKVTAGLDRVVVIPGHTFLTGHVRSQATSLAWSKASGPGRVTFADPGALQTTAQFSRPGAYTLRLTARDGLSSGSDVLQVRVDSPPTGRPLQSVAMASYAVDSPLWSARLKQQVTAWIPHCIAQLSTPGLPEGGYENFVQAANKLAGRPHAPHIGPPWCDAYTLNTVESMCLALMLEAGGDSDILQAQKAIRAKLDEWVPVILAAQEPDGYLQTRFTLGVPNEHDQPPSRWTLRGEHEGYVGGYFIEASIAHYQLTGHQDRRMYDAAKKLADCWAAHIGPPPKQSWFDGHEEIEQALVRLARLVNEVEGNGAGDRYVQLSKFLLDCRRGGGTYDQSHLPVTQQYTAEGHAVRAAYCYSAMTAVATETGDPQYHSAVKSIWDNLVNAKYYVTGGIGSGESAEGFGRSYSLPNNSYCESCSDCGELFFQHNMNAAYKEAKYADLMEETLYNAVLGSVDLAGSNFTYTNPLDQEFTRYGWHGCPCCVGNIPRTLLRLPEWMYARDGAALYVNLYVGSTVKVGNIAGTDVTVQQRTKYPADGRVEITLNAAEARVFALHLRAPDRGVSDLYHASPPVNGLLSVKVNGRTVRPVVRDGYAVITREWKPGDTVEIELPMQVQRVTADERVAADQGRVALRCGPLIYNIESVDQDLKGTLASSTPLTTEWKPDLLDGVMVIHGQFTDGKPLLAVPNYARNNRGGRSIVWISSAPYPA